MTYSIESTRQTVKSYYNDPGCGSSTTYWVADMIMAQKITESLPKDSRDKPPLPLWQHPTSQGLQYTWDIEVQVEEKRTVTHDNGPWCYGVYFPDGWDKITTVWNYRLPSNHLPIGPLPTNWQLDARLQIKDTMVNLGVAVAEFPEACKMFARFAQQLHSAYKKVRRGKTPFGRRRTFRDVSAAHIMTDYGLMPLASDVFDSYIALRDALQRPVVQRVSVFKHKRNTGSTIGEYRVDASTSDRATLYVTLDANARGMFSPGNPLEIAWELIPGSFIVDWVIPIGDVLSSLDALKGVKSVVGTVTQKHKVTKWFTGPEVSNYQVTRKGRANYYSHKRSEVRDIPLPSVLNWDPSSSYQTVLNGLSLMHLIRGR